MGKVSVVIIGDAESRTRVRSLLNGAEQTQPVASRAERVSVAGELCRADRCELIEALAPDAVLLDCAAPGINPLTALRTLAALPGAPRVIAIAATGSSLEERLLLGLGATAYAALDQPDTVLAAVETMTHLTLLTPPATTPDLPLAS